MKRRLARLSGVPMMLIVSLLMPLSVPAQPVTPSETRDVREEAEEARRSMDLFLREQQVLFKRGEFGFELVPIYSSDTRTTFLRQGPNVALADITTRLFLTTFIARYVLIDDLELDLEIPFGYAEQEVDLGLLQSRRDEEGLGDIAGRLKYQLLHEFGARPAVMIELNVKSDTGADPLLGTDHWNVGMRMTFIKTLDPAVIFGSAGYTFTLERNGRDPGDRFFASLGIGYSLNDRVSFNMEVIGTGVTGTDANDETLESSSLEVISLQFGVTVLVTETFFIEPVVNLGLTDDAPDVVVGLSLPFSF